MIHFLFVFIIATTLYSDTVIDEASPNLAEYIIPPMALSKDIPVTIDLENHREFQYNNAIEASEKTHIQDILTQKDPPWTLFGAAFIVIITIVFIRTSETSPKPLEEDPHALMLTQLKSAQELKGALQAMQQNTTAETFFLTIDRPLRKYLDSAYHIGANTSTAQELTKKSTTLTNLDTDLQKKIALIFQQIDQIKYAKKQSTEINKDVASDAISTLLKNEREQR